MTNGDTQGKWVDLKSGAQVLRLWEIAGADPKDPHVAILRLSDVRYNEFTKAARQFLIDNNVFYRKDLNEVVIAQEAVPKNNKSGPVNRMMMIEHDQTVCNSFAVPVRLFNLPPDVSY